MYNNIFLQYVIIFYARIVKNEKRNKKIVERYKNQMIVFNQHFLDR